MYTASHRVHVDAPIDRVFEFIEEPRNHVKVTPGLLAMETTRERSTGSLLPEVLSGDGNDGGWRGSYVYKLTGVRLEGTISEVERDSPSRIVCDLSGAIEGRIRARIEGEDGSDPASDGGTIVAYDIEYDLPGAVLAAVPEAEATAYVRRDLETSLENLKTHLETAD